MKLHIAKADEEIKKIISNTFPSHVKSRKIKISTDIPTRLESYWSGGSKDSYAFYHLDQGKSFNMPTNHPFYESDKPSNLNKLPDRVVIVEQSYFCGKDMGITIYVNEHDITPMLPKQADISENERTVLKYTSRYKNSYGGRTNIRYSEARAKTGIAQDQWDSAKTLLIGKKLLTKAGSITANGRNAIVN